MTWKAIGGSVVGTAHADCEDAIAFSPTQPLTCLVSDGAGSAEHAAEASSFVATRGLELFPSCVSEADVLRAAEELYAGLVSLSVALGCALPELSCTLLGCVLSERRSIFFQIGDGAIVRGDGSDSYTTVWWPQNGEYANTTHFLIDDPLLSNLKVQVLEETVEEVSIFTDGLQQLVLNWESSCVHQPFFQDMFKWLRRAASPEEVAILDGKLREYLGSPAVCNRTDDDKTLFLATRIGV